MMEYRTSKNVWTSVVVSAFQILLLYNKSCSSRGPMLKGQQRDIFFWSELLQSNKLTLTPDSSPEIV
jgi:hypothetical protein